MEKYVKVMPPSIRDSYKQFKSHVSVGGRRKKATKGAFGKCKKK